MSSISIRPSSPAKVAKLSLAALALAAAIPAAHATLLSSESFSASDYPTAGVMLQADGGTTTSPTVTGYTGNWVSPNDGSAFGTANPQVLSGSLSYGGSNYLGSNGNSVGVLNNTSGGEITASNSGRTYRLLDSSLAATASTTGTLYLSFLFQSGQQTGATTYQTLALYNSTLADADRNFDAGLTTNGGQTGTAYNFGVESGTSETYTSTGITADTGVHLFVVKFDLSSTAASDSVTVWIDPTIGAAGDPSGGIVSTSKDITFDRLALSDYDGNSAAWDEIRWGTTFADVAGTSAIPEPSTYAALFGVLALGYVAIRRRRTTA